MLFDTLEILFVCFDTLGPFQPLRYFLKEITLELTDWCASLHSEPNLFAIVLLKLDITKGLLFIIATSDIDGLFAAAFHVDFEHSHIMK